MNGFDSHGEGICGGPSLGRKCPDDRGWNLCADLGIPAFYGQLDVVIP